MSKNKSEGGFISHLTELRQRLIYSFICLAALFVISYFFSDYIYVRKLNLAGELVHEKKLYGFFKVKFYYKKVFY